MDALKFIAIYVGILIYAEKNAIICLFGELKRNEGASIISFRKMQVFNIFINIQLGYKTRE